MGRVLIKEKGKVFIAETVSGEDNPTTPKFKNKKELVKFLTKYGEWYGTGPISKSSALSFVKMGFCPSMVVTGGKVLSNYETVSELKKPSVKDSCRLEMVNKKTNTNKFWEYRVVGDSAIVNRGRIGVTSHKEWVSLRKLNSKIKEKLHKGYKKTSKKVSV